MGGDERKREKADGAERMSSADGFVDFLLYFEFPLLAARLQALPRPQPILQLPISRTTDAYPPSSSSSYFPLASFARYPTDQHKFSCNLFSDGVAMT